MMSCVIRSPSCSQTTMSRAELAVVRPLRDEPLEQPGRADDVRARLLEQVEELTLLRSEQLGELHHGGASLVVTRL